METRCRANNSKIEVGKKEIFMFKNSPEVEALYRFVLENNLRRETLASIDAICKKLNVSKKKRGRSRKIQ